MTSLNTSTNSFQAESEEVFAFPTSFAQQRLWFLHQLAPQSPSYIVSAGIRLSGWLDVTALERSLNEIVRRHESLRTTFMVEAELVQVVSPELKLSLEITDLQAVPVRDREATATQLAVAAAQQPFDLAKDVLLRVSLLQLEETEFILLLVLHHIVADGWSIGVLLRELSSFYTAFSSNQPAVLPELPIQYADFACWQREWLQGEILEAQLSYWQQQLQGLTVLDLPTDYPRSAVQQHRGATCTIAFSQSLSTALESLSQQAGVSLFMTLVAAFQTLLYRYTGQADIAVGTPIANRSQSELEGLIGFFVNSLILRTNLSGNLTFRELLKRVREVTLGAYAHQDLPFEKLVQHLHPDRNLGNHPLFQVAIALQNTPIDALELPGLTLQQFNFDPGTTRLDLEFHLWQTSSGLQGQITYSTDLFAPATIARLVGHYQTLLEDIVRQPDRRLAELTLLTAAEQQLFADWNQTGAKQIQIDSLHCLHQMFELQAALTPDAVAVVLDSQTMTYQELNQRSNQLAHYLQRRGVCPEKLVGVCLERSLETVISVLGILKAGGAYVPIDPAYPQERLQFILEDAQLSILVTQQTLTVQFNKPDLQAVCLDRDRSAIAQQIQENPNRNSTETSLAYVIYTSGSTGQPKGVLVEHRGLINLVEAQRQVFQVRPSDRVLQFASLSFDASIFEISLAFQAGAALYLVNKASLIGTDLQKFLQASKITIATLPPTVLKTLYPKKLPSLHTVISAGETCSTQAISAWLESNRQVFNAYGPTEATVWSTVAEIHPSSTEPTIGRAIVNTQTFVLDADLQLVPIGIPGELYISGVGVARGYLNRSILTAERFISSSLVADKICVSGERLYRTGDRVRYRADGAIEFLGRVDQQVKLHGYRIELGEVEAAIAQHSAVQAAAVLVCNAAGNQQLAAYIAFHPHQSLSRFELRCDLEAKLPSYCIPSRFIILEALPLLPNGKVDRIALATSPAQPIEPTSIAPQTAVETALADLWRQLLHLEQVGIHDRFFDLGGDSLLAALLINKINQQFQRNLSLSAVFQAQTIAQFAQLLEPESAPPVWSPLVPLQAGGTKRPFFCVHPIFGVVFPYWELADRLGTDQPFYGLQPCGLDGQRPLTQIEEMAASYIRAIQTVQPHGPYRLGGWSFGGLVAFEMAQQLQQAGQQVDLLAIMDTSAPISANQPSLASGLKFLFTTVTRSILPFLLDYGSLFAQSSWHSRLQWSAIDRLIPEASRLRLLNELAVMPMLRVFYANSQAAYRYRPKPYAAAVTLFASAESLRSASTSTLGWHELAAKVVLHSLPGNHLSMLKPPHLQILVQRLQSELAALEQVVH